jgi:hypothetical protein
MRCSICGDLARAEISNLSDWTPVHRPEISPFADDLRKAGLPE